MCYGVVGIKAAEAADEAAEAAACAPCAWDEKTRSCAWPTAEPSAANWRSSACWERLCTAPKAQIGRAHV